MVGSHSAEVAALAAAQLEKLHEVQQNLLATLLERKVNSQHRAQVEQVFAEIPTYVEKLQQLHDRMGAISARTVDMRVRSAKLAAEQAGLGSSPPNEP